MKEERGPSKSEDLARVRIIMEEERSVTMAVPEPPSLLEPEAAGRGDRACARA